MKADVAVMIFYKGSGFGSSEISFQKTEAKTECWDYTQVRFNFDDTSIVIYGAVKIFTSVVRKVFPEILNHYKYLNHKDYGYPTKISMPIQKTDWGENGSEK